MDDARRRCARSRPPTSRCPRASSIAIWTPMHLERLARTYWKYLSRVTLGLIRVDVHRRPSARSCCSRRPFVLLRFHAPEYEMSDDRGIVRWRIQRRHARRRPRAATATATWRSTSGAARPTTPGYATVHVEVEIANFYPAIATWVARWFYANTQSRIHVLVTHGFLRSLARLELEESAVGRFAPEHGDSPAPHGRRARRSPSATRRGRVDRARSPRRRRRARGARCCG